MQRRILGQESIALQIRIITIRIQESCLRRQIIWLNKTGFCGRKPYRFQSCECGIRHQNKRSEESVSYGFRIIVEGDYACFTRPELKVERVSYDVPPPGALEGMLKSVYWKPAIRYVIDRIRCSAPN